MEFQHQVNLAPELMGARTMQRLAAELDARGHMAPGEAVVFNRLAEVGVRLAVREPDPKVGDGRITLDDVQNS